MTKPVEGKKYRITVVSTYEKRFASDVASIGEAIVTLGEMGTNPDYKRGFILRIDKYHGNKQKARVFPELQHDGLSAIENVVGYILDTEDADKLDKDSLDNIHAIATKINQQFLKKI